MRAGKLRHRLIVQQLQDTETLDSVGQPGQTWRTFDHMWGSVEPLSGRELYNAAQVQPDVTHKVTMRYRDGIAAKMRIQHKERTLDILSVTDDEEREIQLVLMCKEAR